MSQEELEQIAAYNERKKLEIPEEWKVYKITRRSKWEVSNWGNVKKNGEIYTCKFNGINRRYLYFGHYYIHRAVAELFIDNPGNKPYIDHINTITTDNYVWNLRWVTSKENNNNPITRQHYSEAQKGTHLTEETKKKISELLKGEKNPMYGKHPSEETRKKMRNAKTLKPVICLKDDQIIKIYDALRDVEKDGFQSQNVIACCKGRYKSHHGYQFRYTTPEEKFPTINNKM